MKQIQSNTNCECHIDCNDIIGDTIQWVCNFRKSDMTCKVTDEYDEEYEEQKNIKALDYIKNSLVFFYFKEVHPIGIGQHYPAGEVLARGNLVSLSV